MNRWLTEGTVMSVPKRVFLFLCGVVISLSLAVAALAYAVFVQNEDIRTGVEAGCANSQGLVQLIQELPTGTVNDEALTVLNRSVRNCP